MGTNFKGKLDCETGFTFDDVLLRPAESRVEPSDTDISTRVTQNVELNIPLISAAMDTVTESSMAIAMARNGGLGVIHRNLDIDEQVSEIEQVKRSDRIITREVVTASPGLSVQEALDLMEREGVSGLPVVESGDLVGIVSRRDIRPIIHRDDIAVRDVMTEDVVTVEEEIDETEALEMMYENRVERLPVVDEQDDVKGIITMNSILNKREYENAVRDKNGKLITSVAVSPFDEGNAVKLDESGADILMVDTAHAHNRNVIESARNIQGLVDADVVVGNIATPEAAEEIADFADGIKVGVGPGSICTTRVVSGAGMPQLTAITGVCDVANEYDIPVIADGGIRYSGDISKAISGGAEAVMLGSLFAGTDQAPGRTITIKGKRYKQYRGMGSVGALSAGDTEDNRYLKEDSGEEFVPEGVEGAIPYRGEVEEQIHQLCGGLRSGMGYIGADTIQGMREKARFVKITDSGREESHPHDVMITDEAPNYNVLDK